MNQYQYIKLNRSDRFGKNQVDSIDITEMSDPKSLDIYKVNIINFNNSGFWRKIQRNIHWLELRNDSGYSHYTKDYGNLAEMIGESSKSTILIILPQNISVNLSKLKNKLRSVNNTIFNIILKVFLIRHNIEMVFEPTDTKINNNHVHADFYLKGNFDFEYNDEYSRIFSSPPQSVTRSVISEKVTTLRYRNLIFTTLDVGRNFESFIQFWNYINNESNYPSEWLEELSFYNDKELLSEKHKIESQLQNNRKIKSGLFSTGDELVNCVFEILKEILDSKDDLDNFSDINKEDFLIKKNDITFIGEIKGVQTNVKSNHVDQINKHRMNYLQENTQENVKGLLIINHQRLIHLNQRENIPNAHIKTAESYGCLIIETKTLLKLYEEYLNNKLGLVDCKELFSKKVGLLTDTDISDALCK